MESPARPPFLLVAAGALLLFLTGMGLAASVLSVPAIWRDASPVVFLAAYAFLLLAILAAPSARWAKALGVAGAGLALILHLLSLASLRPGLGEQMLVEGAVRLLLALWIGNAAWRQTGGVGVFGFVAAIVLGLVAVMTVAALFLLFGIPFAGHVAMALVSIWLILSGVRFRTHRPPQPL